MFKRDVSSFVLTQKRQKLVRHNAVSCVVSSYLEEYALITKKER